MMKMVYRVIRHDAGWAYEANGAVSETFRTREAARSAARAAACDRRKWQHQLPAAADHTDTMVKS